MRSSGGILLLAVVSLVTGCSKPTPATADSATVASGPKAGSLDKEAARADIMRSDSAWTRHFMAKNVDSLMMLYAPDAVSMSEGSKAVRGTNDIRTAYVAAVKGNMRNPTINFGGIEFSDDGTMAYDHGSFSATMDGPKGKPINASGDFLNVWKKVGGRWVMVAEISNSDKGM